MQITLWLLAALRVLILSGSVQLAWDPNSETDLAGYKVYYGTISGQYASPPQTAGVSTAPTYTVQNLAPGTYFFVVTAYNTAGLESGFSNEVSTTIAGEPPVQNPVISQIAAVNITPTQASITWTTDLAANSRVDYGTSTSYGGIATDAASVTSHTLPLSGLTPSTLYHARVTSGPTVSSDFTFSTLSPPTQNPVLSQITAKNITDKTASITWTTDISADSYVEYGLTTSYGTFLTDAAQVTTHALSVQGLQAAKLYHYRVRSNSILSADFSFITASLPVTSAIAITGPLVVDLTATTAQLSWKTSVPCTTRLEYQAAGGALKTVTVSSTLVTDHYVRLANLTSGKLYSYTAISESTADRTDAKGSFLTK